MANKVAVKLEHEAALSTEEVDRLPAGQAHWWLRQGSDFVRLSKRVRGDEALDLVVHLEPGHYVLGVGPARGGVREDLEVKEGLAKGSGESKVPQNAAGKKLDIKNKQFVITGDLEAFDRDAAKAWLTNLGAKVTTSVSAKTDYLLVGREPGPKKLEKAAELGTKIISEADLRAQLGLGDAPAPQVASAPAAAAVAPVKGTKVQKLLKLLGVGDNIDPTVEKIVGPSNFADLGITDTELWGIALGPRGGQYSVHINLNDRPHYGIRCSCKDYNPCKHGYALLLTADRHFVPPVPAPDGHEEAARYRPGWE